ncbi:MAG TPA: hypothetical protein P5049_00725 [Methanothrix sp.]|nr:hypothetical protein [Methanothrix sp.]
MRGYKLALIMLALALLAPAASARFEGVSGPGMYYGGAVGGERFAGVSGPTLRYDGYSGGQAYSSALDRWVSIGGETKPDPDLREIVIAREERFSLPRLVFIGGWTKPVDDFSEMVKGHQEEFNLPRAVFGRGL